MTAVLRFCQPAQSLTRQSIGRPARNRACTQFFVESYRWRVPIEHRPIQTRAPFSDGAACQRDQQCLTDSVTPIGLPHEQILEIDAVRTAEGGKIVEPQCEPGGLAIPLGNVAKHAWIAGEQGGCDTG